ncbi:DUF2169 domain-containing protein [Mesorhizobium sp. CAU 1732]|uniref:DUF2169 family type VI secretion system accessory protein n=1 Tax=Mesorhizobium sp. CAU 1732 TaxID=3140358 RepID=UPI003260F0C2
MLHDNTTPFSAIAFEQWHRDGTTMAAVAVRGVYELSDSGSLSLSDHQELVFADEYAGSSQDTALVRTSDLVPFKPSADITVVGSTYPPGHEKSARWECGIKVGELKHILRCSGPREWEATGRKGASPSWKLTDARPVESMPLDYLNASGGSIIGDPDRGVSHFNPLGPGILHPRYTPMDRRFRAPAIDSENYPVNDPFAEVEPQGMAPVPPSWRFRLQHAGTYDDAWLEKRHPKLPENFDYRFYQTAHPALIYPGYLRGDEQVTFAGLTPGGEVHRFNLPNALPCAKFLWSDGKEVSMRLNLDGLHLDLRKGPPWRVDLTWRGWMEINPEFFKVDLFLADPESGLITT